MSYFYLKKSAEKKLVDLNPIPVKRQSPSKPLTFRVSEPTPKAPKVPKTPKELMTSSKLQQKAAGYMLAAANARSKELSGEAGR